jgi:hypothetical protein
VSGRVDKEYRALRDAALAAGWTVRESSRKGAHLQVVSPDGRTIVGFPTSASDRRGWLNTRAQLRRGGVDV